MYDIDEKEDEDIGYSRVILTRSFTRYSSCGQSLEEQVGQRMEQHQRCAHYGYEEQPEEQPIEHLGYADPFLSVHVLQGHERVASPMVGASPSLPFPAPQHVRITRPHSVTVVFVVDLWRRG